MRYAYIIKMIILIGSFIVETQSQEGYYSTFHNFTLPSANFGHLWHVFPSYHHPHLSTTFCTALHCCQFLLIARPSCVCAHNRDEL